MIIGSGLIQAANTFVGAYDAIPSIAAAYSTRRLLTSYTGPLLRLVADRSGYPEQDIGYTAAGDLDTAAAASFLGGDTGYVTKWYDQSGNTRDAVQATLANMPLYVASGQNSKPILRGDGNRNLTHSYAAASSALSIFATVSANTQTGYRGIYNTQGTSATQTQLLTRSTASDNYGTYYVNLSYVAANSSLQNAGYKLVAMIRESAGNGTFWLNGGSDGTFGASEGQAAGTIFGTDSQRTSGDIAELIVCSAALNATARQAAESTANTYWSIY